MTALSSYFGNNFGDKIFCRLKFILSMFLPTKIFKSFVFYSYFWRVTKISAGFYYFFCTDKVLPWAFLSYWSTKCSQDFLYQTYWRHHGIPVSDRLLGSPLLMPGLQREVQVDPKLFLPLQGRKWVGPTKTDHHLLIHLIMDCYTLEYYLPLSCLSAVN